MTDIAALGLKVDSSGAVRATTDLKGLETQAGKTERAADKLSGGARRADEAVKREGATARKAANDNRQLARDLTTVDGSMARVAAMAGRLAGILGVAFSVNSIVQVADSWTQLQNQVGAATRDMDNAARTMQRMTEIARASFAPIDQTVRAYSSAVVTFRGMGRSAEEAANFVEALNLHLVAGYVEGQRAESVTLALSKAMAVGRLQADGLETVLANSAEVAEALANELGTNVNGLRDMASAGKITGDVIANALTGRLEEIRDVVSRMPWSIGGAIQALKTEFMVLVASINQTAGATDAMAKSIRFLADNIARVATIAATFAAYMGAQWVTGMLAGASATAVLTGALTLLRTALIRTGIGALVIAAGELVYWLGRVTVASTSVADGFQRLFNVGKATLGGIADTARGMAEILAGVASAIVGSFTAAFREISKAWDLLMNGMAKGWNLLADSRLGETLGLEAMGPSTVSSDLGKLADGLFKQSEASIRGGISRIQDAGKSVQEAFEAAIKVPEMFGPEWPGAESAADRLAAALDGAGGIGGSGGSGGGVAGAAAKAAGQVDALGRALDNALRQGMEQAVEAANRGADAIGNVFTGLLDGSKSVRQGVADLIMEIAKMQMMDGFRSLFGSGGAFGGVGGWLGGLLGGARANGGPVAAGVPYLVNERTPNSEVFVPSRNGAVLNVPQAQAALRGQGGSGPVNINVNVTGANGDQHVIQLVQQGVSAGLRSYDQGLPDRMSEINSKSRWR